MIPIALPLSCWACVDVGCTHFLLISCGCNLLELALFGGCQSPPLDGEVGNLLLVPTSALTSPCGCANTLSNLLFSPCPPSRSGCRRKSSDAPLVSLLLLLLALVAVCCGCGSLLSMITAGCNHRSIRWDRLYLLCPTASAFCCCSPLSC